LRPSRSLLCLQEDGQIGLVAPREEIEGVAGAEVEGAHVTIRPEEEVPPPVLPLACLHEGLARQAPGAAYGEGPLLVGGLGGQGEQQAQGPLLVGGLGGQGEQQAQGGEGEVSCDRHVFGSCVVGGVRTNETAMPSGHGRVLGEGRHLQAEPRAAAHEGEAGDESVGVGRIQEVLRLDTVHHELGIAAGVEGQQVEGGARDGLPQEVEAAAVPAPHVVEVVALGQVGWSLVSETAILMLCTSRVGSSRPTAVRGMLMPSYSMG